MKEIFKKTSSCDVKIVSFWPTGGVMSSYKEVDSREVKNGRGPFFALETTESYETITRSKNSGFIFWLGYLIFCRSLFKNLRKSAGG